MNEYRCFWSSYFSSPEFNPRSEYDKMLTDALCEDPDYRELLRRCTSEASPHIFAGQVHPRITGHDTYVIRVGRGDELVLQDTGYIALVHKYSGKLYFGQITNRSVTSSGAVVMRTYTGMQKYPYVRHLVLALSDRGSNVEETIKFARSYG